MKLIQIQYFLKVVECKSITKAAEQLFVSQPALSKQMSLMEEELGVKLMERKPSGIELTKTGEAFAKDLKAVVKDLDKAIAKTVNSGKKDTGVLRIGCFDGAVTDDFLPDLLAYFKKAAPELQIRLRRQSVSENRAALEQDAIDMLIEVKAWVVSEEQKKNYNARTLIKRGGAFIYSKNSPLAKKKKLKPSDFEKEPCILLSSAREPALSKPAFVTLHQLGMKDPKVEEVDNFITLWSNINLGLGYSLLSKAAADSSPDLLAYELPDNLGLEIIAVWKKSNKMLTALMKKMP